MGVRCWCWAGGDVGRDEAVLAWLTDTKDTLLDTDTNGVDWASVAVAGVARAACRCCCLGC